ncbi:pyrBI operon leader peptide [Siccibacter turicensis]|uniref:PyrBI operon leader peptide n=1 Tax=Siccibacter turicensis TaxID=357233 RepID=A0A2P8VMX2_9ENTR|nr:pyrBI operon leader peptide [Siccibacter turicensis]
MPGNLPGGSMVLLTAHFVLPRRRNAGAAALFFFPSHYPMTEAPR